MRSEKFELKNDDGGINMYNLKRVVRLLTLLILISSFSPLSLFAKDNILISNNSSTQSIDWEKYFDWNTLDTNIYWYDKDGIPHKNGSKDSPFDKNKKTVIYVHGWQKDTTKKHFRESFFLEGENTAKLWCDKNWNIGIFYWNQLADEKIVNDAEKKIWSSENMRWRKPDGSYVEDANSIPNTNAARIFYNAYVDAMKGYKGSEIRIIGHSLGNQMATRLVKFVSDKVESKSIDKNIMPTRLVLLDPFWSRWGKDYLNNKWTGEACREIIKDLVSKKVIIESYQSSGITGDLAGDDNIELKKMICYSELKPWYVPIWDLGRKHTAAVTYYMLSIANSNGSPIELIDNAPSKLRAPSAATSNSTTMSRMGNGFHWVQEGNAGSRSITPSDDVFKQVKW